MDMKEKLVELLKESKLCSKRFDDQYSDGTIAIIADYLIANGVAVSQQSGNSGQFEWIPVTDRLPDTQTEVLTYSECNGVRSACLLASDGETMMWYLCRSDKLSIAVTHWMPLPQPPKGE